MNILGQQKMITNNNQKYLRIQKQMKMNRLKNLV